MEIFRDIVSVTREPNSILTVGTFDGLHLGHQYIVEELKKRARSLNAKSTLVTFDPHPKVVLRKNELPKIEILTTIDEKIGLLKGFEIDRLLVIHFTYEFSRTSPANFVRETLYDKVGFSGIVIGYDHAFGKNREGDISTLQQVGDELNFWVDRLEPFKVNRELVSSTKIRQLLSFGDVKMARKLLGRPYTLHGEVVDGDHRGKTLGFPTANIKPAEMKLVPANGVYAVQVSRGDQRMIGMMNIGVRPTFSPRSRAIEVHIFNFNENIYGEELKVSFIERIRDEKHFSGSDELITQLRNDQAICLDILRNDRR